MWLSNLADVARSSGLNVVEVPGWQTRGHGGMSGVKGVLCHHTGGASASANSSNYPSLNVVRDGRADLPGPLAHLGLGRDGTVYVIAAGACYHAGKVWHPDFSNDYAIGIEAENSGGEQWPEVQISSYVRLVRALMGAYGIPIDRVVGHKEAAIPAGRKVDPSFDMNDFRNKLQRNEDDMTPDQENLLRDIAGKVEWLRQMEQDGNNPWGHAAAVSNQIVDLKARVEALTAAVDSIAKGQAVDGAEISKVIENALKDVRVTLAPVPAGEVK